MPRTASTLAVELQNAAGASGRCAAVLLVGHSFGAPRGELMSQRGFATDVAGPGAGRSGARRGLGGTRRAQGANAEINRGVRLCRYGVRGAPKVGSRELVAAFGAAGVLGVAGEKSSRIVSRGGIHQEDEGILAPVWKLPPSCTAAAAETVSGPDRVSRPRWAAKSSPIRVSAREDPRRRRRRLRRPAARHDLFDDPGATQYASRTRSPASRPAAGTSSRARAAAGCRSTNRQSSSPLWKRC